MHNEKHKPFTLTPKTQILSPDQLKKLNKVLPIGSRRILAVNHGVSESYVYKVLEGLRYNYNILMNAIHMAEQESKRMESERNKLTKRLDRITDED